MIIEYLPYSSLENMSSLSKIYKILKLAKDDKIVLIEGRLSKLEETELMKITMEEITDEFKGIEFAIIDPKSSRNNTVDFLKMKVANFLIKNRLGLTIVGPANIVKEIKRNPNKIELLIHEINTKKNKK